MTKSCTECGLVKEFIDFDIDPHNMTGHTAKCKECRGTLPVKSKRKYTRKPRKAAIKLSEAEGDLSYASAEEPKVDEIGLEGSD